MYETRPVIRALACGVFLVALACGSREGASSETGDAERGSGGSSGNPAQSRLTEAGLYRVSLRPEGVEAPLGRMHAWILRLETRDGETFLPSRLAFSGGMPQHGHGFETEPRVTRAIGEGDFLIEGVKFHMGGEWTLRVELVGPAGPDVAVFQFQVGP